MESHRKVRNQLEDYATTDVNRRNESGDNILTQSLKMDQSDDFIISLITRGCDVNKSDSNEALPLHLAMRRTSIAVGHKMINCGANINGLDAGQNAPLHLAIGHGNLEALCMLLCYGADVTISNRNDETPLLMSLNSWEQEMAEVLISYYDDLSCTKMFGDAAFELLLHSLSYGNDELFKMAWSQLDHELLLNRSEPFVLSYLRTCEFPVPEWAECFFLILSSPVAPELIQDCRTYTKWPRQVCSLMSEILVQCSKKKLQTKDRLALIYLCTSLGATVNGSDIYLALKLYGYNKEYEALVYTGNFIQESTLFKAASLVPAFYRNIDRECIFNLVVGQIKSNCSLTDIIKALGHFSMSSDMKHELKHLVKIYYGCEHYRLTRKLSKIPAVPSLLEISRNQVRKFVTDTYKISRLYQFYDVAKKLHLPRAAEDVFLFKAPIYY